MKRSYFCPRCETPLDPGTKIILSAAIGERRGLVLLSPQPGDYRVVAADTLALKPGDRVDLRCPVCQASLTSPVDANLAEIGFRNEKGDSGWVNFSRTYGEHATYFVTSEKVHSYGEDAERYEACNFFGEGRRG